MSLNSIVLHSPLYSRRLPIFTRSITTLLRFSTCVANPIFLDLGLISARKVIYSEYNENFAGKEPS